MKEDTVGAALYHWEKTGLGEQQQQISRLPKRVSSALAFGIGMEPPPTKALTLQTRVPT